MSRNTKAAKAAATTGLNLSPELLEQLIPGQVTKANFEDVFAQLKRAVIERVLGGELEIATPRDRAGSYEPQLIEWRGKPAAIRSDNGPEYISRTVKEWAGKHGIELKFIQPGNPQQNAYIERFNRTMRYELLSPNLFGNIEEVQEAATEWAYAYNHDRPSMALNGRTPIQHLQTYLDSKH